MRQLFAFALGFVSIGQLIAADPLNLLIITTDDMSADSVEAFGCQLAGTTPHMDQLAKEGLRFRYARSRRAT